MTFAFSQAGYLISFFFTLQIGKTFARFCQVAGSPK
jgi:hypothetical protein